MPICSTPAMVRNAEEVGAVGHLEVAVGRVVVADQGQAVGADGHGAVLADIASAVHGGEGRGGTGRVGAVGYFEVAAGRVVITDEAQAVGADCH